ncbi:hypothetical protein [Vibrio scophthalmi]|uniref:Uncharacterized protein n=1 Tax=Vibrio scophthalmi TaxID=45658 RepID=A0A1E3WIV5_9VIBR|nr:hypothetical protein [Vibrio scophthalmi]ODS09691.1 hypothetical protein VSF3289_03254 [Vibrio scophthalmi]
MQQFERFVIELKKQFAAVDLDFDGAADDPDMKHQEINLSFLFEEEVQVFELIIKVRDSLSAHLTDEDDTHERFPIAVHKSRIHGICWSVVFYFADDWALVESIDTKIRDIYS